MASRLKRITLIIFGMLLMWFGTLPSDPIIDSNSGNMGKGIGGGFFVLLGLIIVLYSLFLGLHDSIKRRVADIFKDNPNSKAITNQTFNNLVIVGITIGLCAALAFVGLILIVMKLN